MKLFILSGFAIGLVLAIGVVFVVSRSDGPVESHPVVGDQGRWYNTTYPTSVTATIDGVEQTFTVVSRIPDLARPQVVALNVDYGLKGFPGITVDGEGATVLGRTNTDDPVQQGLVDALVAGINFSKFDPGSAPYPYRSSDGSDHPDPASGITENSWTAEGRSGKIYANFRSRVIIWDDSPEGTIEYSCQMMDNIDRGAFTRLVLANAGPGVSPVAVDYPEGVEGCVLTGPPH